MFYDLFILEVHVPRAEEQREVPPGMAFCQMYRFFLFCLKDAADTLVGIIL